MFQMYKVICLLGKRIQVYWQFIDDHHARKTIHKIINYFLVHLSTTIDHMKGDINIFLSLKIL